MWIRWTIESILTWKILFYFLSKSIKSMVKINKLFEVNYFYSLTWCNLHLTICENKNFSTFFVKRSILRTMISNKLIPWKNIVFLLMSRLEPAVYFQKNASLLLSQGKMENIILAIVWSKMILQRILRLFTVFWGKIWKFQFFKTLVFSKSFLLKQKQKIIFRISESSAFIWDPICSKVKIFELRTMIGRKFFLLITKEILLALFKFSESLSFRDLERGNP